MLKTVALLASALLATASAYPNPRGCTGVCGNAHDPSIVVRDDGTYFRFSTNGKVAIHTAPSISGPWSYQGPAIPAGSIIDLPGRDGLWAPDVQLVNGTYYLYYSVSTFGSQNSAIGVATSKTLDAGSWIDHGAIGVTSVKGNPYNAIDANLVQDGSDFYMTFGSFWKDIHQVKMSYPPTKVDSKSSAPFQITYDPSFDSIEGAYVFPYGDFFYLFYSQGQCCGLDTNRPAKGKEYKIKVCRSIMATGGFVDRTGKSCTSGGGTIVLESHDNIYAPGGQGVYDDPENGPIVYYHYVDTTRGYSDGAKLFGWNQLDFSSGWPVAL